MPGYILHLTAARMYLDHLPSEDSLCCDLKQQNRFFLREICFLIQCGRRAGLISGIRHTGTG